MRPGSPAVILNAGDSITTAILRMQSNAEPAFLVGMSPSGWSSVARETLQILAGEGKGELTLGSALPARRLPYFYPDLPLEVALRYVNEMPAAAGRARCRSVATGRRNLA